MELSFNCYDCEWLSDKCKNKKCSNYNEFPENIKKCDIVGNLDNSLGCSWDKLKDEDM